MSDERTRRAWATASGKYEREHAEVLEQARTARLAPIEEEVLAPEIGGAAVVHPMSGHGVDDHALIRLGAASVIGLDYSEPAVRSAQRRADELAVPCRSRVAELPVSGLPAGSADVVYTGKGALIWVADLDALLAEVVRLLRPGGVLFVYEAHPLVPLWQWHPDRIEVRQDRSYFATEHVNDTFPGHGARERQHTLAALVGAVLAAGLVLEHLAEHPEPFWRPDGVRAAAWDGRVPNTYSLLARLPQTTPQAAPQSS